MLFCGDLTGAVKAQAVNIELLSGDLRQQRFGMPALPAVLARGWAAWSLVEQGQFSEASRLAREAIQLAREAEHPYSEAVAMHMLARSYCRKGEFDTAVEVAEAASQVVHASDHRVLLPWGLAFLAECCVNAGQHKRARTLAQDALEIFAGMRLSVGQRCAESVLAEAHLESGALDAALQLVATTLDLARAAGERLYEVWALRLLGEIHARGDPPDLRRAEEAFRSGIGLAAEIGMRPHLAHCHLGLGGLFARTGRKGEASEHLETALRMYREMDMQFYLKQSAAELKARH